MNCVLIGSSHDRYLHIRLSLEVQKSPDENLIMVFLLSVLPLFSIMEAIHRFSRSDLWENY